MQNFLGEYTVESKAKNHFTVKFEIPENCEYVSVTVQEINFIIISLKEGNKTPTVELKSNEIEFVTTYPNFILEFQHEFYPDKYMEGNEIPADILRKPRISVEN